FVEVACSYGIDQFVLQNFTTHVAKGPFVNYVGLLNDVIKEKEKRSNQLVTNLFNEMDRNGDGRLSRQELRAMLESDAFECDYEDVDEVLENMDDDGDGYVDFEEMKRAIMEDGRIAVKDEADRGERPQGKLFG
ncbi:Calcium-binding protein 2 (CaBP2), partial [Durusdinium trenchii]